MSSKEQQYHHVSIEENAELVEPLDLDEESSSFCDSYTASYKKSVETLQSFREIQRSRHDTIAMLELREYLDRISRRRTGYGIDPYVQRVMAAPPRRTLLRNRKVEAPPATLVGSLPAMLRQPQGLTRSDLLTLLDQAVDKLRQYTAAAVSRVYVVEDYQLHLHSHVGDVEALPEGRLVVTTGDTTVGYVAASGDLALVEVMSLVHQDRRYPRGLPWAPPGALQSALAVPLCDDAAQRRCRAVVVLAQTPDARMQLGWKDVTAAVCLVSSLGAVVGLSGARTVAQSVYDEQDSLLRLLLDFFAGKATVPATLAHMLRIVKAQMSAARGMLFLIAADDPTQAHLFRESLHPAPELIKRDIMVSLSEDATAVLEACQRLEPVVLEAEHLRAGQRRLSRHLIPQARVRAGALCLPLAAEPGQPAVAVLVLADKLASSAKPESGGELDYSGFSVEEARRWLSASGCAPLLSLVCGLARREVAASGPMRPQAKVLSGWVVLTLKPHATTLRAHANIHGKPLPPAFREWGWAPSPLGLFQHIEGVHLIVAAAEDLLGGEDDIGPRSVWVDLAYRIAYAHRDVPYHNFRTALSVLQCVYAILWRNEAFFTDVELQAIFTAALGLHLDHRGLTEQFIKDSDHPLSHCYPPPILHNHHFECWVAVADPTTCSCPAGRRLDTGTGKVAVTAGPRTHKGAADNPGDAGDLPAHGPEGAAGRDPEPGAGHGADGLLPHAAPPAAHAKGRRVRLEPARAPPPRQGRAHGGRRAQRPLQGLPGLLARPGPARRGVVPAGGPGARDGSDAAAGDGPRAGGRARRAGGRGRAGASRDAVRALGRAADASTAQHAAHAAPGADGGALLARRQRGPPPPLHRHRQGLLRQGAPAQDHAAARGRRPARLLLRLGLQHHQGPAEPLVAGAA